MLTDQGDRTAETFTGGLDVGNGGAARGAGAKAGAPKAGTDATIAPVARGRATNALHELTGDILTPVLNQRTIPDELAWDPHNEHYCKWIL